MTPYYPKFNHVIREDTGCVLWCGALYTYGTNAVDDLSEVDCLDCLRAISKFGHEANARLLTRWRSLLGRR